MSSYNALSVFYDELTSNVSYRERARYFDGLIKKFSGDGKTLLDLGCGTGRLSEELSSLGYDVIGADISVDMLSVAQQNKRGDILYICQDMRKLELYRPVDAIVSALDTINHLTKESDVSACFKSVYNNLSDGGIFVFDMNTIYKHKYVMGNNSFVYDMEDVYCVWNSFYEEDTNINEIVIDLFERNGDVYLRSGECFCERAYETEKIKEMLKSAGFTVVAVYDSDSEEAPREDSERLVYIARK